MIANILEVKRSCSHLNISSDSDGWNHPRRQARINTVKPGDRCRSGIVPGERLWRMINHLVENCLEGGNVLSSVVVVEGGGRGGFAIGLGDREAMFVGRKEVPVTSDEEGAIEWVGKGEFNVDEHLGGDGADKGGGELLVVDVPGDRGGLGEGRETEAEGAARNGKRVVDMEVGEEGGGGLTNKNGDTCFSGIVGEGGEKVEVDKNGPKDEAKGLVRAMNFLEKHYVDRGKEFVEMSDFGLLTYGVVMKKGATVPGGDTNRFGRERVGNRLGRRSGSGARSRGGRRGGGSRGGRRRRVGLGSRRRRMRRIQRGGVQYVAGGMRRMQLGGNVVTMRLKLRRKRRHLHISGKNIGRICNRRNVINDGQ